MTYISFKDKNVTECELALQTLTKESPNFFEAWITLYLVYMYEMKDDLAEDILVKLTELRKSPLKFGIHKIHEISWNSASQDDEDIFLNSTKFFIKTGCYEFAELSIIKFYLKSGLNCNDYQYFIAVIDYLRGNYKNALHHLDQISLKKECITKLKGHALFKLQEFSLALEEFNIIENYDYLIYLRCGTYFNLIGDFEKGKSFLWECCNRNSSYNSWMGLGVSYFEVSFLCCYLSFFLL